VVEDLPTKTLDDAYDEASSDTLTLIFRVPQEKVPDLTLVLKADEIDSTIGELKHKISQQHPFKPEIGKQRILFGGKLLQNDQILSDLLKDKSEKMFTFHLMIFTKKYHTAEEEKKEE
jgi:hypothetical protein